MTTPQESIRIYTVLDQSAIIAARDRLATMFAGRPEDETVIFSLSQDAARVWFSDIRVIWKTTDPRLLAASGSEAEIAARQFIGRMNTLIQNDHDLADIGIDRLFPDDLRPSTIALVNTPYVRVSGGPESQSVTGTNSNTPDHWIVRFDAYLPTGTSLGSIAVFGATIDIRVGARGAIAGCWLEWRSCIPQGVTPLIPYPPSADSSTDTSQPIPMYLFADEGTDQSYVAPYYFFPQDEDGDFIPASLYSPVVKIVRDTSAETARVTASILGGSQRYALRWLMWDPTNLDAGILDMGSDDGIDLEPGTYDIGLRVTDVVTGVVAYAERSVYTDMFASTTN